MSNLLPTCSDIEIVGDVVFNVSVRGFHAKLAEGLCIYDCAIIAFGFHMHDIYSIMKRRSKT